MAEWLLKKGYLNDRNYVAQYDPRYSAAAETILDQIKPTKSASARIFSNKFSIALSNNDLKKAELLLVEAESTNVPRDRVMASKALMMWLKGDYVSVTKILESVAEHDSTVAGDALLMAAYARLGRPDLQDAYYKREVDRNPTSAWVLGNYAFFLLFTMDDVDGAISYGDKALKKMQYPLAQNTTALAYLMKASILKRSGNAVSAKTNVNRALSIGFDENFVFKYCLDHCTDIRKILAR
jgi:tetratricopeptide (TPR) repeat protein